jgi:hypothetical protein
MASFIDSFAACFVCSYCFLASSWAFAQRSIAFSFAFSYCFLASSVTVFIFSFAASRSF